MIQIGRRLAISPPLSIDKLYSNKYPTCLSHSWYYIIPNNQLFYCFLSKSLRFTRMIIVTIKIKNNAMPSISLNNTNRTFFT